MQSSDTPKPRQISRRLKKLAKISGLVFGIALIFLSGVGVGSGQIRLSGLKTVQHNLPANLNYSSVEEVYDSLRNGFDGQLSTDQLLDGLKGGLAKASGDPYTEYLSAAESKDFDEQLNGTFEGIGAELSKQDKNIVIVAPLAGFPADKAGLRPLDIIAEINGQSAYDLKISEAVNKIRGPKGTTVKLTIVRSGQVLNFEITREQITIPSVSSEILTGNIGYLKITRFGEDTAKLSTDAATKFKNAGVKGVILDLRNNPGGLLEAAVDVSSLWLDNQTVLYEKRDGITIQTYKSRGQPVLKGIPTVVLINEGSASASEITAGALKDNQAATTLGVKSFGKGSVQELRQLKGGGVLKVTIARWYTPSGRNIDKDGIAPDKAVKLSDDDLKAKRDPQKDAALALLKN